MDLRRGHGPRQRHDRRARPDLGGCIAAVERHLSWDGCLNVRDLGGFATRDGRTTRWGAVVRSERPATLTEAGWQAAREHGIRTIVDLRDRRELDGPAPDGLATLHVPVLDLGDDAFLDAWRGDHSRPGFYRAALAHWPGRFAEAVVAIARAAPGGVLVHCQAGRDRTGLVAALLLSLAGVQPAEIAADYALSEERLRPLYDRWIREAPDSQEQERLQRENMAEAAWMLAVLEELDAEAYLLAGGATPADLAATRARLVD